MRRSPRFAIVTAVVTILAILGAAVQLLHPFLPAPEALNSYSDRGDYLQAARSQQIGWQPLSDDAFVQAASTQRPILLVVGAEWSRSARKADRLAFSDSDLQALISSDFIPVRVDCDESPEWLNAYYPLSRYSLDLARGNQAFFLSPNGTMYDYVPSGAFSDQVDNVSVTQDLLQGRDQLPKSLGDEAAALLLAHNSNAQPEPHGALVRDINVLMGPSKGVAPSMSSEAKEIKVAIDPHFGGTPINDIQVLLPEAYRFSMLAGDKIAVAKSFGKVLSSPLRDWIDGGFYHACDKDWTNLQFDKLAVTNAGMMFDCAAFGKLSKSPYADAAAESTFDCLASQFVRDHGLLASCRIGDEGPGGRSGHSSFEAKDIRDFWNTGALTAEERHWAAKYLNLDLDKNPQLVPWVADPAVFLKQKDQLHRVLRRIRVIKRNSLPHYGTIGYADVNGYTAARMIECARLWNDPARMRIATQLKDRLDMLRSGANIDHWLRQHHGGPELTDYLGYSDAALQYFLATGDSTGLDLGLQVLLEAKRIFELSTPGAWLMARSSPRGLPKDYLAPELADNIYESCTAREIRLMTAYSRLLAGNPDTAALSSSLAADARAAILQFEPAATELGIHAAGYFCAAYLESRPYAITVGPQAVDLANKLYRLCPLSFVAPASGSAREDLQEQTPGIYVVKGGKTLGPFLKVEDVSKMLR